MVVGYHDPRVGVALMSIISLIFWFSYFRYLCFFIHFSRFPKITVSGRKIQGKAVSEGDFHRIYIDCFDASFGFLLLNLTGRKAKALLKSRIRNRRPIEVYKSGSVYIYEKGKFHLLPLVFPVVTSFLLFLDLMEVIVDS